MATAKDDQVKDKSAFSIFTNDTRLPIYPHLCRLLLLHADPFVRINLRQTCHFWASLCFALDVARNGFYDVWLEVPSTLVGLDKRGTGSLDVKNLKDTALKAYVRRNVLTKRISPPLATELSYMQRDPALMPTEIVIGTRRVLANEYEMSAVLLKGNELKLFISPDYLGHIYVSPFPSSPSSTEAKPGTPLDLKLPQTDSTTGCTLIQTESKLEMLRGRGIIETWILPLRSTNGFTLFDILHLVLDRYTHPSNLPLKPFTEPPLDPDPITHGWGALSQRPPLRKPIDEGCKVWFVQHSWGWLPFVEKAIVKN